MFNTLKYKQNHKFTDGKNDKWPYFNFKFELQKQSSKVKHL